MKRISKFKVGSFYIDHIGVTDTEKALLLCVKLEEDSKTALFKLIAGSSKYGYWKEDVLGEVIPFPLGAKYGWREVKPKELPGVIQMFKCL